MTIWRNVIGLTLAGGLLGGAGWMSGCIGGAQAQMSSAPVEVAAESSESAPEQSVARYGVASVVEHGPAGFIGLGAQWELGVFEIEGQPVAKLRKVAVDGELLDPSREMAAQFAFDGRALDDAERSAVRGTAWEHARVVQTAVDLRGAFEHQELAVTIWYTDTEVVGVWSTGDEQRRGGALVGHAQGPAPHNLRDVEALPTPLRCAALGRSCPAEA